MDQSLQKADTETQLGVHKIYQGVTPVGEKRQKLPWAGEPADHRAELNGSLPVQQKVPEQKLFITGILLWIELSLYHHFTQSLSQSHYERVGPSSKN